MTDTLTADRPDRIVSLSVRADVADRLDDMAARYGVTVPELTRHLLGNLAALADALPSAFRRSSAAARKEPRQ